MDLKRISLIYAITYLLAAGIGLALVPSLALRLIFSTGVYGDVMPRVAGVMMIRSAGSSRKSFGSASRRCIARRLCFA